MRRCIILELKEKLINIINTDKKTKILMLVGIFGIIIILLSEYIPHTTPIKKTNDNYISYVDNLEQKTEYIISSINGVGKCNVMITIKNTKESVYAKNNDSSSSDSSYSTSSEYVFYDGTNGDEPVLIKEFMPEIQGVVVVCQGGDNPVIQSQIVNAISSLYGISSTKISISRLRWYYG